MHLSSDHPIRKKLITQLICVVLFIIVPVLVTAALPATWVTLERSAEGRVSATARTCVLFVIPWRTQHVADVSEVEAKTIRSDRTVSRRSSSYTQSNRGLIHQDGEDELSVLGREGNLTVSISPASSDAARTKVQAFLDDASQHHSWTFTIPNWKFGLGFCGPFTLFSWLYIIGSTLAILRFFTRKLRGPRLRASA
jgi:hypothetical protein